jgi:DNA-directed RNA polymerase I, II, and III subunit RPABC5
MIIPIRCFTCHKVLGDKWEHYSKKVEEHLNDTQKKKFELKDLEIGDKKQVFFSDDFKGDILNELKINKICCRRHMLGHVDLINLI